MQSKVSITTPSTFTSMTTLERVKAELGITNSASDALLLAKIAEASSDLEAHIGGRLCRERLTQLCWGVPNVAAVLVLARFPVASIVSLAVDDDDVDLAELRLDEETGLLTRLTADGYPCSWHWAKSVSIVFDAGYLMPGEAGRDLPPVLEAAAVELVSSYWAAKGRDPLVRVEDIPGVMRTEYWVGAVGEAGSLPPSVESKIEPFRRGMFA